MLMQCNRISKLKVKNTALENKVVEGISEACSKVNCAVIGGETATLPGVYNEGDYDVVGFMVGSMK